MMSVVSESVPPTAMLPVSLFPTDLAVVSGTPLFTVKEGMIAPVQQQSSRRVDWLGNRDVHGPFKLFPLSMTVR
jgi:hypothetical protein